MKKEVLPNHLTVLYEARKSNAVVVEVMVKTGSNHELPHERGISHFLEHILFEGTARRPSNWHIAREIERIGGEFNAYTTNERTCFHVKVLKKHFPVAVEVLADILQNPLFRKEDLEKEKKVVLKEMEMVQDEPRFYQWILLQKNLFQKHPARFPTYGSREHIRKLTPERVRAYFQKHYVPNNMVVSVVGNVPSWRSQIHKAFTGVSCPVQKPELPQEMRAEKSREIREKKKIANSYLVMGFPTVPKKNRDAYPLEVLNTIWGQGQSGRMFTRIRSKLGLAYDVGTQHVAEVSFGYFSVYACVDQKNIQKVRKVIQEELCKPITVQEVKDAQRAIEGEYYLEIDDEQKLADQLLFWEQAQDARELKHFVQRIKEVKLQDIQRVIRTYFQYPVTVILEGG